LRSEAIPREEPLAAEKETEKGLGNMEKTFPSGRCDVGEIQKITSQGASLGGFGLLEKIGEKEIPPREGDAWVFWEMLSPSSKS